MSAHELLKLREKIAGHVLSISELHELMKRRESVLALSIDGKNAEERKARLAVALANDAQAEGYREELVDLEYQKALTQTRIDYYLDLRREREWNIRERQIAAFGTAEPHTQIDERIVDQPLTTMPTMDDLYPPKVGRLADDDVPF